MSSNFIILDDETEIPLYGTVLLKQCQRSGKNITAKIFRVPAEAWVAFLQARYKAVPEVRTYLEAVHRGDGINPGKGTMLEAIDQRVEIPIEEWEHAVELCRLADDDEGEEWKRNP